jgi:cysteine-rich repeat protein
METSSPRNLIAWSLGFIARYAFALGIASCGADGEQPAGSGTTDAAASDATVDGSQDTSDSGSATSEIDTGSDASTGSSDTGITTGHELCGNGEIDQDEICDDGNTAPGDGCSETCHAAPGMIHVPAGMFNQGCSPSDTECYDNETLHEVFVSAFEIDEFEVTHPEYLECVDDAACTAPACAWDDGATMALPVACVQHEQALQYCEWAGKRLPTEAEWEKAARGTDDVRIFPWGDDPDVTKAVVMDPAGPEEVGSRSPSGDSPYGLKDMVGNVSEWVADWFAPYEALGPPWDDPQGPPDGVYRVHKGGNSGVGAWIAARISVRALVDPPEFDGNIGFRCARTP